MNQRLKRIGLAACLILPLAGWADAAAEETVPAEALKKAFDALLPLGGELARFVTVKQTWRGYEYEVRVDPPLLFRELAHTGLTVSGLDPFILNFTRQPAGTWGFEQYGSYDIKAQLGSGPSAPRLIYRAATTATEAQLSDDLRTQPQLKSTISDLEVSLWTERSFRSRTVGTLYLDQTMKDVTPEHADLEINTTELRVRDGDRLGEISARKMTTKVVATDARYRAVQDLFAEWLSLVQGKQEAAAIADQLRPGLQALMPIAAELKQTGSIEDAIWAVDGWEMGVDNLGYSLEASNLATEPTIHTEVNVSGIDTRGRLTPSMAKLVPERAKLSFTIDGLNFQKPWEYIVDGANFGARQWLNENQRQLAINYLVPKRTVDVTVDELELETALYQVTATGTMSVDRNGARPSFALRITTADLDPLVKYLQENTKRFPQFGQYAFFALMAQGFAGRTADGAMSWDVVLDADGRLTINGRDFAPPRL
ncbi:hypothetical protein J2045_004229 [Peteryoungia aggregata LMG 23059]|uniref:DUF945 family protein n=1 Tax=Peteryoungia aggregata LMG 23059 TaxID=1368425 RepID=A0ABU0GCW0_9HYPH|nr:hypothetical protein [Peteryoungia aggregata]MDQ0423177.1 hypothetical protein [Peteryoungia aggregata LMG 23059]